LTCTIVPTNASDLSNNLSNGTKPLGILFLFSWINGASSPSCTSSTNMAKELINAILKNYKSVYHPQKIAMNQILSGMKGEMIPQPCI
jgi:hypothetical protein